MQSAHENRASAAGATTQAAMAQLINPVVDLSEVAVDHGTFERLRQAFFDAKLLRASGDGAFGLVGAILPDPHINHWHRVVDICASRAIVHRRTGVVVAYNYMPAVGEAAS